MGLPRPGPFGRFLVFLFEIFAVQQREVFVFCFGGLLVTKTKTY